MKILVIAHNSFSDVLNNGKTLESLFKNFEKDQIAQLFFSENEIPDFNFCNNYYKITDIDVFKSIFKNKNLCGKQIIQSTEYKIMDQRKNGLLLKSFNFAKKYSDKIVLFRDYLWKFNSWKSKGLYTWIENFKPNAIFYVGGDSGFSHEIAVFLSNRYNIPLSIYFTDDYLIFPKNRNIFDFLQRKRMKKFYNKTVSKSELSYAIGDSMAEEYTNFFNKKFLPIMNSIENVSYHPYIQKNNKIIISYFGGLHLNRWKMLIKFAEATSNAQVNIYSIANPEKDVLEKFKKAGIQFKGSVSGNDLQNAILASDVLLHVESDDDYNRLLTKLSISTKIPEYLISGRLVIGFGPTDVASMKILSSNNIGIVLSSEISKDVLREELDKIVTNFELRKKIGKRGYDYAVENFNNQIIAEDFKKRLLHLAKHNEY